MAPQKKISVIVVSYNTREILRACLQSVFASPGSAEFEVIVVDNNSADGSALMVREDFPGAILIANNENRGFAAANNQGLWIARGQYLLLLNSDTVVLDDVLLRSVAYMSANPQVGAMGCRVLNSDGTLQLTCFRWPSLWVLFLTASGLALLPVKGVRGYERMAGWERDGERDVDVITGCYLMLSRQAYEKVGGLDEAFFFYGEESDWCRRLRGAGFLVRFAPAGEIVHLGGASGDAGSWQRRIMLCRAIIHLHRKHHGGVSAALAAALLFCNELSRGLAFGMCALFGGERFRRRCVAHLGACRHSGQAISRKESERA